MEISPDNIVYWQWGFVKLNATIIWTWVIMLFLVIVSWLITRRLSSGTNISRGQNLLEIVVAFIREQIRDIAQDEPDQYLSFVGTLFLLILVANLFAVIPYYNPPTGSLTTTSALAFCVFIAVPVFGVAKKGVVGYIKNYLQPSPLMLPFNIIGDLSRILALAIRLFGNIMSGTLIAAILLSLAPLLFPVIMHAFGLLIGVIQAYIFAVLAMVYIASAVRVNKNEEAENHLQQKRSHSHG